MGRPADLRQRGVAFGWRAARSLRRRARAAVRRGPEISVIVPFYNVEEYLADCLDSILANGFGDYEVLLVDDGSPDGSRVIADEYAAKDHRIRVVTRENGGLGAARNTGVREAKGRYLTFVDSDDLLPPGALGALHHSATQTGAEIVCGSVERFDSRKSWAPSWVDDVHLNRRTDVRIEEFLPLLRNLYTWNKLFRADFFRQQGLWFREGVAYEDQPIVTQLFARATKIDVLPDIVYRYRQRDDQSSISQQTASLKDLRDRIKAWEVSREAFRTELSDRAYQGWLQTLFDAHFQWYLQSTGTVDDDYWNELTAAIRSLAAEATDWVWDNTPPAQRVLVRLAIDDRRSDAQEFVRRGGVKVTEWPSKVREDGILMELPLYGDPGLDESLFVIRRDQVKIAHAVENVHWTDRPGGGQDCWISGWAFLRKVDLAEHEQTVTLLLKHATTGEVRAFPATEQPEASYPPPRDDMWCDYAPGRFGVDIPLSGTSSGHGSDVWEVWVRVEAAGLQAEQPVTRLIRSGSAGNIPASNLGGGDRLVADWTYSQPLRLRVDRGGVVATGLELKGRTLTGVLEGDSAGKVANLELAAGSTRAPATWTGTPDGGRAFSITMPGAPGLTDGRPVTWHLVGFTLRGQRLDVLPEPDTLEAPGPGALVLETNRVGSVVVSEWRLGATADAVRISNDGLLTVSGRLLGGRDSALVIATRNKRMQVRGQATSSDGGRFTATLELRHDRYRFGRLPFTTGDHDLHLLVGPDEVEVPLQVAASLGNDLPLAIRTDDLEGRVVRGPAAGVRLTVQRPLGKGRGTYHQHMLRTQGPTRTGLTRGVLFRSYFGESATDNGLSIQRELERRGSDLPVYWAVQDKSVAVPEGGIPVVVNSPEFYELLFSVKYYVDNMYQPEWHHKPDGQVLVQTFHGYPFKQMGHPHWRNIQFSQAKIDAYDERAAQWDYLVSPARYATPLLTRDFNYHGEVLEIGYPRNDILKSPEAPALRETVRRSLGIEEGQTAVLYAPTFRDYLATNDTSAAMADFFDFEAATKALGDEYVFLVRGHAFNARSHKRIGSLEGCREVTDYPEVSDLYLAADAGVVDYSSLRFDFGVTGKPMLFHVPDLQRYKDTRGWLFDFEPTAPGPLLDTTEEVVDRLQHLDDVRRDHAEAYDRFTADYLDLEDGKAGERFVDAVFVPRGDA